MLSPAQLPPRELGASHNVWIVPAASEIFFSFPWAKNPIHSPSGEKKGLVARSVPVSAFDSTPSMARTKICSRPFPATYATSVPWGDTAREGVSRLRLPKRWSSGSDMANLATGAVATGGLRDSIHATTPPPTAATMAAAAARRNAAVRVHRPSRAVGVTVGAAVVSNAPSSARRTSPMSRMR
jgi:hypothetical protein